MKLEDLEEYRNNEGFIDFDRVLELARKGEIDGITEALIETRGSAEKFKQWFELDDCAILVRSTMFTGEIANYTEYAELIIEELAKQVSMPCAHYDLLKINGINGNLSVNVLKKDNQSLTALSQNQASLDVIAGSTIDEVMETVRYYGNTQGTENKNIKSMNKDIIKMIIFDTFTMQTDRHMGNISIIYDGENMEISPMYDNECSLMLDKTKIEIQEILEDKNKENKIRKHSSLQEGVIILGDGEKNDEYFPWEDMLYFLTDNSEFAMEFAETCAKKLNIEKAINNVEKRIKTEIPKDAKEIAVKGFNYRKRDIERNLIIDVDNEMEGYDDDYDDI